MLDSFVFAWYNAITAKETPQTRKEVKSVNKEFFKLPKAVKRAVWAALLSEWQKKKPADR